MSDRRFILMLTGIDVAVWLACFMALTLATDIGALFCVTFACLAVSLANCVVGLVNLARI